MKSFIINQAVLLSGLIFAQIHLALADEDNLAGHANPNQTERQYTFTWNFSEQDALKPRGGKTKGVPVKLQVDASEEWKRLQEKGIDTKERDRRAILAMTGEYRVSFDFIEVAGFTPNYQQTAPYQSWATEKVYVLEDKSDFISLQHILVMRMVDKDGKETAPMVTKHWRQDWRYQPKQVLQFKGYQTWQSQQVADMQRKGAWSQTVYQVDDSPRYGCVAKWEHMRNYSSWNCENTWRALPRREYSVRDDYQVLMGNNRHIILPTGWVHEQQNNKMGLDKQGQFHPETPIIAREFGYNRYERIQGFDFREGDEYLKNTEPFWAQVRKQWDVLANKQAPIYLKAPPDKDGLYIPLFGYASRLNAGEVLTTKEITESAKNMVDGYLSQQRVVTNQGGY